MSQNLLKPCVIDLGVSLDSSFFITIISLVASPAKSLKFISKCSLFSSSLLLLLWLKPLLFLACLGQQPYNVQNCSRCCQCSVHPLTLTVPRLAEGLVQQPPAPLCLRAFSGLWRLLRLCHGHRKCWGVTLPEAALTIGG